MKNLLILGGMAIAGIALFGKRKLDDVAAVVDHLKVNVQKLRNIKISGSGVNLNLDVQLVNPTPIPISIDGGDVVKLQKIEFYSPSGVFLGESTPSLGAIEIPAKSGVILANVPATISTKNAGEVLTSLIGIAGGGQKQLKYRLHFEALGKTVMINA